MITYNRGATWQPLPVPKNLAAPCANAKKCSLQLHISYSPSVFNAAPQGPLSIDNATGLIIAHGHVGDSLQTKDARVSGARARACVCVRVCVSVFVCVCICV